MCSSAGPRWYLIVLSGLPSCFRTAAVPMFPLCNLIETKSGDLTSCPSGSFLPISSNDLFLVQDPSLPENLPGSVVTCTENIIINKGHDCICLHATNTGDQPVQVCLLKPDGCIILNRHRLAHTTTLLRQTMLLHSVSWIPLWCLPTRSAQGCETFKSEEEELLQRKMPKKQRKAHGLVGW